MNKVESLKESNAEVIIINLNIHVTSVYYVLAAMQFLLYSLTWSIHLDNL